MLRRDGVAERWGPRGGEDGVGAVRDEEVDRIIRVRYRSNGGAIQSEKEWRQNGRERWVARRKLVESGGQ